MKDNPRWINFVVVVDVDIIAVFVAIIVIVTVAIGVWIIVIAVVFLGSLHQIVQIHHHCLRLLATGRLSLQIPKHGYRRRVGRLQIPIDLAKGGPHFPVATMPLLLLLLLLREEGPVRHRQLNERPVFFDNGCELLLFVNL